MIKAGVKNFFKPDDFKFLPDEKGNRNSSFSEEISQSAAITCAKVANETLNKLIESWPSVYWSGKEQLIYREQIRDATHKARLAFIEEIQKEPCKHEALVIVKTAGFKTDAPYFINVLEAAKCRHCGVALKATWSEKK